MKRFKYFFGELSVIQKVLLGFGLLFVLGVATPHHTQPTSTQLQLTSGSSTKAVSNPPAAKSKLAPAPVITTKTETDTQAIPFSSTTIYSSRYTKGSSRITTAGANGSETLTYTLTFSNGAQTNKQLTNTVVTTQPVTQVTTIGTYVAPAPAATPAPTSASSGNTYTNVDGNQVESPDANTSGATAKCNDGTYSHSQHHSGTCSGHGGVAEWLY